MKKSGELLLWIVGIYLGLMLGSGLVIKTLLSGSKIRTILSSVESRLPVTVSSSGGSFDLVQWFLLRPAIKINDLAVGNPKGFSSEPMLAAKEASAHVRLLSLFHGPIDILQFKLVEPVLRIEPDRSGATNVEALAEGLSKSREPGAAGAAALAIGSLIVDSGSVSYQRGRAAGLTVRNIDLSLTDFSADRTCRLELSARLFGGTSSRLEFQGQAGPYGARSLPARGDLAITLAPSEIPPALREEYFGDLLREPAGDSRAKFETALQGDLMGTLEGQGKLSISGFQLGRNKENRVPLAGEAPLRLAVRKLMADPALKLLVQNASLQLGQGRWKGRLEMDYDGSRVRGSSSGAITGVRIEEMLGAFTSTKDAVFGLAEIPNYTLQFSGKNAAAVQDSLTGQGQIRIEEGRIALFNLLDTIRRRAQALLGGEVTAPGQTDFTRLAGKFDIRDQKVLLTDLALEIGSSVVNGQGYFGFDHSLNFDLTTTITGDLAAKLGGRPDSSEQSQLLVPVKVRGTVESPKAYPDVAGMAQQEVVEKAKGLLDSLFKKKTEPPK